MKGSALYKRSTFFIDVFNVILYIDLFLYHEMVERMKTDESLVYYFKKGIPEIKNPIQDVAVLHQISRKNHINILEDWIDKKKFIETNSIDFHSPEELYRDYIDALYVDMLTNSICEEYIQATEYGNTMKLLLKDQKIESITFYVPFESEVVAENLFDLYQGYGDKLKIFVGEKTPGDTRLIADSYVFENVTDIDKLLCTKRNQPVEVLIPTYEHNMIEGRTNNEKLVEQVTYQRLKLKNENVSAYMTDYNLSIHTISVPI